MKRCPPTGFSVGGHLFTFISDDQNGELADTYWMNSRTAGEACFFFWEMRPSFPYFDAVGSNTFYYGKDVGNSQAAKLINNLILGINMNAVAEGMKLGNHYNLPLEELLNLLKVSTGDSWVVRNWSDVSEWTAATALAVLQKDLIAAYNQGIKHDIPMPFNALSSTQLFSSMEEEKPKA